MTTVETALMTTASAAGTSDESFHAAMAACSPQDQDAAALVAADVGLANIVHGDGRLDAGRQADPLQTRLQGQGHPDSFDFAVLLKLDKHGPMRASDLAEHMCADPSTVSRQVSGLVKAGLIERRSDANDGRASILIPTQAGRARIDQLAKVRGRVFAPIMAHWSADDRATFHRLLSDFKISLADNLEAVKNVTADLLRTNIPVMPAMPVSPSSSRRTA